MRRREFMMAALAASLPVPALALIDPGKPLALRGAARDAYFYGLPLIEMAATRARSMNSNRPGGPSKINAFKHVRALLTPKDRNVTGPNNDTLYSTAWIDLRSGPATIRIPALGERYFSLQLMDMFTNTVSVLGTRTMGGEGGTFTIVGPNDPVPMGAIRSPTPDMWALGRMLVESADDLPAAHKLQDQLTLNAPAPRSAAPAFADHNASWPDYFASVQALLLENPPPPTDDALFGRIARLGLKTQGGFDAAHFSIAEAAEIAAGVVDARASLMKAFRMRIVNGWEYPPQDLGDFGQDYPFRGAVAQIGLAALIPAEALYLRPLSANGTQDFDGDGIWRLHLQDGGPPVDAFWSVTMYEQTPDHQAFLTENPINRYSIGDRTPGLRKNTDGSIDIWISRADPGGERSANWLPAPKAGPFFMSMRNYLPRPEMIEGRYRLAPIEKVA